MRKIPSIILLSLLLFCSFVEGKAQQLAFPGAEGFGRFTTGGRGGVVYEVTNLKDAGPGSLREGLEMSGPRTIVFRLSGTIQLNSEIRIRNGDLTIAGQTAPGDGIAIKGQGLVLDADNMIIRYLRIRPGDVSGAELDALWGRQNKDIIIDHCSLSWSTDEVGSFYDNERFSLQWCILSESLYQSVHGKGRHGYGGIWGGMGASFHHNLLAHHSSRNPRFNGARYTSTPETEVVDYRNNVIFNWGGNSAYGGEGGNHNMVANYYKPGPATSGEKRYRLVDPDFSTDVPLGKWYVSGNYVEGFPEVSENNWDGGVQGLSAEQLVEARMEEAFSYAPVESHTANEAYRLVLSAAGANYPYRDAVDVRIVQEVENGSATYGGVYGAEKGIIDTQETVGGWLELFAAPAPVDSDHDGMPDECETSAGLDPEDAEDRNADQDGDGYTNLEEYLESVLHSAPADFLRYPAKIAAQEVSTSSIALRWEDNSERETEIILERSPDDVAYSLLATLPANTTSFLDEGLEPGTLYYYRLKTRNETQESVYSIPLAVSTKAVPSAPDPSALVGYWGFDDGSGREVQDKSPYQNHGMAMEFSQPAWVAGKLNRALDFSQATASTHILVAHEAQLNFDKASFSVSLWLKASALAAPAYLFHKGTFDKNSSTGASGKWYGLELTEEHIGFAVDDAQIKSEASAQSSGFFTGEWVHVLAVRDTESRSLKLYRNGKLIQSAADQTYGSINQTDPFIMANSRELNTPYTGLLDEVKVFAYALSESEIAGLYTGIAMPASMPTPAHEAVGVKPDELVLGWRGDAPAYRLYLGTSADELALLAGPLSESFFGVSGLSFSTAYFWRVDAVGENGNVTQGNVWSFASGEITGLGRQEPRTAGLFSCVPNPFSEALSIRFELQEKQAVLLALYDMQNRLVRILKEGVLKAGVHEVQLNMEEPPYRGLQGGVYYCLLRSPEGNKVKRLLYFKAR